MSNMGEKKLIQHFVARREPDGRITVHVEAGDDWVGDFVIAAEPICHKEPSAIEVELCRNLKWALEHTNAVDHYGAHRPKTTEEGLMDALEYHRIYIFLHDVMGTPVDPVTLKPRPFK